jgi:homoserine kinase
MSSDQNSKLLITAVAAAAAGSALTVALLKLRDKRDGGSFRPSHHEQLMGRLGSSANFQIVDDAEEKPRILFPHNHEEKMRQKIAARHAVEEDNSLPRKSVTVRVPATSANMGPGCEYSEWVS